jgi:transcriptional regulator with XRE-family HTH domain
MATVISLHTAPRVAPRLLMLRNIARLTRAELAERCGVYETTIEQWEQGAQHIPGPSREALAEFFEVSEPFLMGVGEGVRDGGQA